MHDLLSLLKAGSPYVLPELRVNPLVVTEMTYRARDFSPSQCLEILKILDQYREYYSTDASLLTAGDRLRAALLHRLLLKDGAASFSAEQVLVLASHAASAGWLGREAMLCGLTALQRRGPGGRLPELLEVYAAAGVRDSHWNHICATFAGDSSQVAESLAKLSLPHCAEKLGFFENMGKSISTLYAAAILELTGKRQPSLDLCKLSILNETPVSAEDRDRRRLIKAAAGDYRDLLAFKSGRPLTDFETAVRDCLDSWTGVRIFSAGRLAIHLESVAEWLSSSLTSPNSAIPAPDLSQESFVLVECLSNDRDWYHESEERIVSKSMREKRHCVKAERDAEIAALRQAGWKVLVVSEKEKSDNLADLILKQFLSLS